MIETRPQETAGAIVRPSARRRAIAGPRDGDLPFEPFDLSRPNPKDL